MTPKDLPVKGDVPGVGMCEKERDGGVRGKS